MIKDITLCNWMSFEKQTQTFSYLNILSGENCSGKTNMLRCFSFLEIGSMGFAPVNFKDFVYCKQESNEISVKVNFSNCPEVSFLWGANNLFNFSIDGEKDDFDKVSLFNGNNTHVRITDRLGCDEFDFKDLISKNNILTNVVGDAESLINIFESFGDSFKLIGPVLKALFSAKEGDLLIIEHPENGMHPKICSLLGKMFAVLAQSGVQLFVETHSDHIINGIRVAVKEQLITTNKVLLHFFERNGSKSTITEIKIDETGELDKYPKDFLDQWCDDLIKLIQ